MNRQKQVINEVKRIIELGNSIWQQHQIQFNNIEIRFTLRGKTAGRARYVNDNSMILWLHPQLIEHNVEEYIKQTVAHEIAHLFQRKMYPRSKPHGLEFKTIARRLGNSGARCHTMNTKNVGNLKKRFVYQCDDQCRPYSLTSYKHRQQQQDIKNHPNRNIGYICKCGKRIYFTGKINLIR